MYYGQPDINIFKTYDHEVVHLISSHNTKPLHCSNHKQFPAHTGTRQTEYDDGPLQRYTYLLTYLLTPWSRVLLEKLTGSAGSQETPRIFGTRRFLTVVTSARHLSLS